METYRSSQGTDQPLRSSLQDTIRRDTVSFMKDGKLKAAIAGIRRFAKLLGVHSSNRTT